MILYSSWSNLWYPSFCHYFREFFKCPYMGSGRTVLSLSELNFVLVFTIEHRPVLFFSTNIFCVRTDSVHLQYETTPTNVKYWGQTCFPLVIFLDSYSLVNRQLGRRTDITRSTHNLNRSWNLRRIFGYLPLLFYKFEKPNCSEFNAKIK